MTEERLRVWPKPGVLVRDELTGKLLEPGQWVLRTRAVERRLRDGDLLREPPIEQREHGVTPSPEHQSPSPEGEQRERG